MYPALLRLRVVREAAERPFYWALGGLAALSLLFMLFPAIDLTVAALFFAAGSGFLHERLAAVEIIREAGRAVERMFALASILPLLIKLLAPDRPLLLAPRASLFVLASFLIGPGLIVNGILKKYWGRARPRDIVEFGGDAVFTRAWQIADQCAGNCSFVSGEAASAFWLVSLAFIVPAAWRGATIAATLAFAAIVSATRIAMGGHFLSDVLIAWIITLLVMLALNRAMLRLLPPSFDGFVDAALTAAGRSIRRALRLQSAVRRR